jgi:hypothetical protein
MRVAALVIAAKLLLAATVLLSLHLLPTFFDTAGYLKRFHWPPDEEPTWSWQLKTWDSAHYLFLSEEGYAWAGASAAYYPLWPSLIGLVRPLVGSSLAAALLLANLLSVAALVVFHRLVARSAGRDTADTSLLLAIAYPGAMFFCFGYSESLFLLITVGVFALLASDRLGTAAGLSILAPMTRAVGVLIVIPVGWYAVAEWRRGRRPAWQLVAAAAPVVGFLLTLAVMWAQTGDAWIGFEAQRLFASQGSIAKLFDPVALLGSFLDVWGVHGVLHSALDRAFFVFMLVGAWLTFRFEGRVGPLTLYAIAMILVPAMTMSFMSFTRYSAAAFPVFIGFGAALASDSRREPRWLLLAALLVVQLFFLLRHVNSLWAG